MNNLNINNNLLTTYNDKLNIYFKSIINMKYLFEVTKCCGYSEFLSIYKENTSLNDLYNNVRLQFHMNQLMNLWIVHKQTGEKILIPCDENAKLREFILNNNNFFVPIYPVPSSVVYKIYFDDGMCHEHHDNNICSPCVLHT